VTDCQSGSNWRTLGSPLFGVPHQSALLLLPAAASLAAFAWLLTLHPFVAGRVYVSGALLWLWWVDGVIPDRWDLIGVAVSLAGIAMIV
jgi:small multidrug resistance family-3 protein